MDFHVGLDDSWVCNCCQRAKIKSNPYIMMRLDFSMVVNLNALERHGPALGLLTLDGSRSRFGDLDLVLLSLDSFWGSRASFWVKQPMANTSFMIKLTLNKLLCNAYECILVYTLSMPHTSQYTELQTRCHKISRWYFLLGRCSWGSKIASPQVGIDWCIEAFSWRTSPDVVDRICSPRGISKICAVLFCMVIANCSKAPTRDLLSLVARSRGKPWKTKICKGLYMIFKFYCKFSLDQWAQQTYCNASPFPLHDSHLARQLNRFH